MQSAVRLLQRTGALQEGLDLKPGVMGVNDVAVKTLLDFTRYLQHDGGIPNFHKPTQENNVQVDFRENLECLGLLRQEPL